MAKASTWSAARYSVSSSQVKLPSDSTVWLCSSRRLKWVGTVTILPAEELPVVLESPTVEAEPAPETPELSAVATAETGALSAPREETTETQVASEAPTFSAPVFTVSIRLKFGAITPCPTGCPETVSVYCVLSSSTLKTRTVTFKTPEKVSCARQPSLVKSFVYNMWRSVSWRWMQPMKSSFNSAIVWISVFISCRMVCLNSSTG